MKTLFIVAVLSLVAGLTGCASQPQQAWQQPGYQEGYQRAMMERQQQQQYQQPQQPNVVVNNNITTPTPIINNNSQPNNVAAPSYNNVVPQYVAPVTSVNYPAVVPQRVVHYAPEQPRIYYDPSVGRYVQEAQYLTHTRELQRQRLAMYQQQQYQQPHLVQPAQMVPQAPVFQGPVQDPQQGSVAQTNPAVSGTHKALVTSEDPDATDPVEVDVPN
jgi:hypothetical protein